MIVARYLDPLVLVLMGEGVWKVRDEFRFDSAALNCRLVVPAGRLTDLASVPRLPLVFWLVGDTAHAPAVLHDEAYRLRRWSRAEADALFLEAMETDGSAVGIPPVTGWRRRLLWAGVRLGGASHWGD